MLKSIRCSGLLVPLLVALSHAACGQTTVFTYQGQLTTAGAPANGGYDLQFALFDSATGATQIGSTETVASVFVSDGLFTVPLDFGTDAFPGGDRFLEIAVRQVGAGSFTTLTPRQQINSSPYAIRARNATSADALSSGCVGCVQDAQIGSIAGTKVSGAIPVASLPSGSTSYIQNATSEEANANFNISGNGTAGGTLSGKTVNAVTEYDLNGDRFLTASGIARENTFTGFGAGLSDTPIDNSLDGNFNSFFGFSAGAGNTAGYDNAFFGAEVATANKTGARNSFVGYSAGANNIDGSGNVFVGADAGFVNSAGSSNTFVGAMGGIGNDAGTANTLVGSFADVADGNLSNATAIGANAVVAQSNSLVLGSIEGVNGAAASVNVGVGTTTPTKGRLQVDGGGGTGVYGVSSDARGVWGESDSLQGVYGHSRTQSGVFGESGVAGENGSSHAVYGRAHDVNAAGVFGVNDNEASGYGVIGSSLVGTGVQGVTATGKGLYGLSSEPSGYAGWFDGRVQVNGMLCATNVPCNSDARLKQDVTPIDYGLPEVMRLRPVTWKWKKEPAGKRQLGLVAQDVEPVLPELVEPEAHADRMLNMDYIGLVPVVIKAIQQQQAAITKLTNENAALQKQNAALAARLARLEDAR